MPDSYYTLIELLALIEQCDDWQLAGADKLHKYGLVELSQIANGIGADWMPARLRRAVDRDSPTLQPVALIHDVEYHEGGSEADRELADLRFLENGRRAAAARYAWFDPRRYRVRRRAMECYTALRAFGAAAWPKCPGDR